MMKDITFHINNVAYTVNIGEDPEHKLEQGVRKFLDLERNLHIEDLISAYLKKTNELIEFEEKLKIIIDNNIPRLDKSKNKI